MKNFIVFILIILTSFFHGQSNFKKDVKNLYKRTYSSLVANDSLSYKNLFLPDTGNLDCANKMHEEFIIYPSFRQIKVHLNEVIENKVKATEFEIFDNSYLDTLLNPKKPTYVNVYSLEVKFFLDKKRMRSLIFSMSYYKDNLLYLAPPGYGYTLDE